MEEAIVIGTVVANQAVPSLRGRKLIWITPVDGAGEAISPPLVAIDVTQSGRGSRVIFVRGREAAQALADPFCPVDAAVLGIVDESRMGTDPSEADKGPEQRASGRRSAAGSEGGNA